MGTSSEIGAGGRMGEGGGGTRSGWGRGAVRFWAVLREPEKRAGQEQGSGFLDGGKRVRKMGDAGERTGAETPRKEKSLDQRLRGEGD